MQADDIANQSIANLCVNTVWGTGPKYIKTIQGVIGGPSGWGCRTGHNWQD